MEAFVHANSPRVALKASEFIHPEESAYCIPLHAVTHRADMAAAWTVIDLPSGNIDHVGGRTGNGRNYNGSNFYIE